VLCEEARRLQKVLLDDPSGLLLRRRSHHHGEHAFKGEGPLFQASDGPDVVEEACFLVKEFLLHERAKLAGLFGKGRRVFSKNLGPFSCVFVYPIDVSGGIDTGERTGGHVVEADALVDAALPAVSEDVGVVEARRLSLPVLFEPVDLADQWLVALGDEVGATGEVRVLLHGDGPDGRMPVLGFAVKETDPEGWVPREAGLFVAHPDGTGEEAVRPLGR